MIEQIADYRCITGENPMWHPLEKKVYWLDIPSGRLFRYDPSTQQHENFFTHDEEVGGFTIQPDGGLLLFMSRGAIGFLRGNRIDHVVDEISEEKASRFNDVIADPAGRVFCGTMPQKGRLGVLYRLETDGSIQPVLEGIGCSNGMGFSNDLQKMYYTDSGKREIYLFDYDQETGDISNQRVFVKTPDGEGVPDGMTVDREGYVWSARWDGSGLFRFDIQGNLERKIELPASKVSSVVFGGDDYTDIYATTAGGNDKIINGSGAGALFRIKTEFTGKPDFFSRLS